jgi:hypothetical protein
MHCDLVTVVTTPSAPSAQRRFELSAWEISKVEGDRRRHAQRDLNNGKYSK